MTNNKTPKEKKKKHALVVNHIRKPNNLVQRDLRRMKNTRERRFYKYFNAQEKIIPIIELGGENWKGGGCQNNPII